MDGPSEFRPGRGGATILLALFGLSPVGLPGLGGCLEDGGASQAGPPVAAEVAPPAGPPSAEPSPVAPDPPVPTPPSDPSPRRGDTSAGFGSGPVSAGPPQPRDGAGPPPGSIPPIADMPRSPAGLPMLPVELEGERFLMELALDETTRRRGLGGRRRLARDRGMLFVHPRPEILGYWMKDCFMDIDIVYVDALGRVTATYRMKKEPPRRPDESLAAYHRRLPSYSSRRSAALVLEFAPGTLDRLDLRPGEPVGLDVTALRALATE